MRSLTPTVLLLLLAIAGPAHAQTGPVISNANMQTAAAATGNGTALDVSQQAVAVLQVSGTFVGTVTFEGSLDGSTWNAVSCYAFGGSSAASTATAAAITRCNVTALLRLRARVSAYTSGSITVKGNATSLGYPFAATNN